MEKPFVDLQESNFMKWEFLEPYLKPVARKYEDDPLIIIDKLRMEKPKDF